MGLTLGLSYESDISKRVAFSHSWDRILLGTLTEEQNSVVRITLVHSLCPEIC